MNEHASYRYQVSHARSDWVKVMVQLDRPPADALAQCNRVEKLKILKQNAQRQRTDLVYWIEEHGLSPEVAKIGVPTTLNLLFIQCTPHAAEVLVQAPGVTAVMLADERIAGVLRI